MGKYRGHRRSLQTDDIASRHFEKQRVWYICAYMCEVRTTVLYEMNAVHSTIAGRRLAGKSGLALSDASERLVRLNSSQTDGSSSSSAAASSCFCLSEAKEPKA